MNSLGGPAQVVYLVSGLVKRGHEARLICPEGSGIHEQALAAGLPVIPIRFRTELDPTVFFKIYRAIRRFDPQVVHLHSRRGADFWGGLAARACRVKAVILSRRVDYPVRRDPFSVLKYGCLCDKIITVSNAIKKVLIAGKVSPEKIVCVHSVVDPDAYNVRQNGNVREELGIPEDAPLIGIVAQLIERKGHKYLFDALPAILSKFPNTKVLVLGRGPLEARLRQQVVDLGVSESVIFAGFRKDIPILLSELDILVHPALMEGLGVAILQAMASGIPVIATPVGGIPEAVIDGVTGLLVPPRNSEALGTAVLRLLSSPDIRMAMGQEGKRAVQERFSLDSMVEGTLKVYREVLTAKGCLASTTEEPEVP